MNLVSMSCPNCGAKLDGEDELDEFYCDYCGYKIIVDSDARRAAKVRLKELEVKQRIRQIDADVEKSRIEHKTKRDTDKNRTSIASLIINGLFESGVAPFFCLLFLIVLIVVAGVIWYKASAPERQARQEEKQAEYEAEQSREQAEDERVQELYDKARDLLESGKYDEALRIAESIEYDPSFYSYKEEEWEEKKKELIFDIRDAMGISMMITMPEKASYYRGKNPDDVVKMLEDLGFLDIRTEYTFGSAISMFFDKEDEVSEVSINGITDFKKGTEFKDDSVVIVRYVNY